MMGFCLGGGVREGMIRELDRPVTDRMVSETC